MQSPGTHFTKCSWANYSNLLKIHVVLVWTILIISGHNFAHAMTAAIFHKISFMSSESYCKMVLRSSWFSVDWHVSYDDRSVSMFITRLVLKMCLGEGQKSACILIWRVFLSQCEILVFKLGLELRLQWSLWGSQASCLLSLRTEMAQVFEILPRGSNRFSYITWLVSWLLVAWWCKETVHQQQWYWCSLCWLFKCRFPIYTGS